MESSVGTTGEAVASEKKLVVLDTKQARPKSLQDPIPRINRLPLELLVIIFRFCITDCHFGLYRTSAQRFNIMLVCWHWYDAVRSCPTLWRFVEVGSSAKDLQTCLKLSAMSLISLFFGNTRFPVHAIELILPHSHRIEALNIQYIIPALSDLLHKGMPQLQELEFAGPDWWMLPHGVQGPATSDLMLGLCPQLHSLTLANISLSQDFGTFPQLRSLFLVSCSCSLSLDQFVDAISACVHLEELFLCDVLDRMANVSPPRGSRTTLTHMKTITLRMASCQNYAHFLSRLILPTSVYISMRGQQRKWTDEDQREGLFPRFLPSTPSVSLPVITNATSIRLIFREDYSVQVKLSARVKQGDPTRGKLSLTHRMERSESKEPRFPVYASGIVTIFRGAPVTRFEISLEFSERDRRVPWTDLFSALPALECLEMIPGWGLAGPNMWGALRPGSSCGGSDRGALPCPRLRRIILEGDMPSDICYDDVLPLDEAIAALSARASLGARLEALVFNATILKHRNHEKHEEEYIKKLRDCVDEFTC